MQDNTSSKHLADMRCPHCNSQDVVLGDYSIESDEIKWYCQDCGQSGNDAEGDVFIYHKSLPVADRRVA